MVVSVKHVVFRLIFIFLLLDYKDFANESKINLFQVLPSAAKSYAKIQIISQIATSLSKFLGFSIP